MTCKQALIDLRDKVKAGEATEYSIFREFRLKSEWQALNGDKRHNAWEAYNGSLDAAKALHEAVLGDEWNWSIDSEDCGVCVFKHLLDQAYIGNNTNPARAWLLAILEALIAQEGNT